MPDEKVVTLEAVATRAMKDEKFFKSLRANHQRALNEHGLKLSAADAKRLQSILDLQGTTVQIDLDALRVSQTGNAPNLPGLSWIGMWSAPFGPGGPKPKPPHS